jgi:hypothetical protein
VATGKQADIVLVVLLMPRAGNEFDGGNNHWPGCLGHYKLSSKSMAPHLFPARSVRLGPSENALGA